MLNSNIALLGSNSTPGSSNSNKEWDFAGKSLDELLELQGTGDDQSKQFAEAELDHRYHPCVRGKDDEIQMNPHYRNDRSWIVRSDKGLRYRTCVTYEDPNSPTPQTSIGTDRIANNYEAKDMDIASQVANNQAKPKTARWWGIYFSTLTKKDITVNRIMTGIRSDGYPWNRIGYSEGKDTTTDDTKAQIDATLAKEEI